MSEVKMLLVVILVSIYTNMVISLTLNNINGEYHSVRHSHAVKQIRNLKSRLDNVILRQKTDHILIGNLQRGIESLQNEFKQLSELLVKEQQNDQSESSPNIDEVYIKQDAITKSESPLTSNVKATVSWVIETLPSLQRNIEDLQEEFKLQKEMHDKQELESKVSVIAGDVTDMRRSLYHVISKAESASAAVGTLDKVVAEKFKEIGKLEWAVSEAKEQIGEQNSLLDILLKSYPDGYFTNEDRNTIQNKIDTSSSILHPYDTESRNIDEKILHHEQAELQQTSANLMRAVTRVEKRQRKKMQELRHDISAIETLLEEDHDVDKYQGDEITQEKTDIRWILGLTRDLKTNVITISNQVKGLEARTMILEQEKSKVVKIEPDSQSSTTDKPTELLKELKYMINRGFQLEG